MNEKKIVWNWVREHKEEILFAAIAVIGIRDAIIGIRNQMSMQDMSYMPKGIADLQGKDSAILDSLLPVMKENVPTNAIVDSYSFEVSKNIRNLTQGWQASPEKTATAIDNGFVLQTGQTWVKNYTKGEAA